MGPRQVLRVSLGLRRPQSSTDRRASLAGRRFRATFEFVMRPLVAVASSVPRQYTSAAFGIANMAILTVGGLFFEPLIGILTKLSGLDVPDAGSLSVLIWAPGIALFS